MIPDQGIVSSLQTLLEVATPLRLMCVAAHPDDEDSETLAYYNRRFGVQTSILLANWGEGGQNETGPELYEELGVIRSHETLEAARLVGTQHVYCLNQKDFGFSKTAEETWSFWDHAKALEDTIQILRQERPHVIITNHRVGSGHGNHQAMAELIAEAIPLAASPEVHQNQITGQGLRPWRVLRLFQQRRHHEGVPIEEVDVSLPVGEVDILRGVTYQEIAAEALNQHRSQGIKGVWARVNQSRGSSPENHFSLVLGDRPAGTFKDLFSGIPLAWWLNCSSCRFCEKSDSPEVSDWRNQVWYNLRLAYASLVIEPATAERAIAAAVNLLATTSAGQTAGKAQANRLETVLGNQWGARIEMQVSEQTLVPGKEAVVSLILANRGSYTLQVESFHLDLPTGWMASLLREQTGPLGSSRDAEAHFLIMVPTGEKTTLPETSSLYLSSQPWQPNLSGMAIFKKGDIQGKSEISRRMEIAAPWEVWIEPGNILIPKSEPIPVTFTIHARRNTVAGATAELEVTLPDGKVQKTLLDPGSARRSSTRVTWNPGKNPPPGSSMLTARLITQTGIFQAQTKTTIVDLRIPPKLRVGIVKSYDTTLPDALQTLGIEHSLLGGKDLETGNLDQFQTILIDIRGYLERPDLRYSNQRVLKYVSDGGHLVVFYHKSFDWNDADPPYAPYPLHLSGARVTEENAKVQLLKPSHPLFTTSNRILSSDWEGWIQERGLYFPDTYDTRYEELISMADTGSEPLKGGILWAKYGKGTYVYTSLTWYRQLRALVPGAYRLFANLITPSR